MQQTYITYVPYYLKYEIPVLPALGFAAPGFCTWLLYPILSLFLCGKPC